MTNGSGALGDLKIENSKNQTFNSDLEDSASVHGLNGNNLVSIRFFNIDLQPQLPPIFMPNKKGQKKKPIVLAGGSTVFNSTKKNFPTLKKVTDHKKTYVSPYSIHAIKKP